MAGCAVGLGEYRGDADLLPAATVAPQAHEIDQHAGGAELGDQTAHACGADLSELRQRLRLVRALAVETHEEWLETSRYLNMEHLHEHKKQLMRAAA
jgi:hypothetical protein